MNKWAILLNNKIYLNSYLNNIENDLIRTNNTKLAVNLTT